MAKKNKAFILNRKDYNRIRKMDHCQMTLWAESIYKSGFKDGADAVKEKALDVEQVRSVLLATKGFGVKRVADVCKALEESLDLKGIDGSGAE